MLSGIYLPYCYMDLRICGSWWDDISEWVRKLHQIPFCDGSFSEDNITQWLSSLHTRLKGIF